MSQLKVDSIIPRSGIPSGSNGGVIQVKHDFCDNFSSSNTSYVDTGLSITMTPSSSSSKFIITINGIGSTSGNDSGQGVFRVTRGNTPITGQKTIADNNNQNGAAFAVVEGQRERYPVTTSLIDAPNTTSSVTYKLRVASPQGQTAYLGRWGINNDWSVNTYMTVYEVSG
tara:strand:+ start:3346 stop:3855 length:510 start_codon:yes stop_codon:yes gene_type:complete